MLRVAIGLFLAYQFARHATWVFHKWGLIAGATAMVFMLAYGEAAETWFKMIKSRWRKR